LAVFDLLRWMISTTVDWVSGETQRAAKQTGVKIDEERVSEMTVNAMKRTRLLVAQQMFMGR
jgi:hypothetical protein